MTGTAAPGFEREEAFPIRISFLDFMRGASGLVVVTLVMLWLLFGLVLNAVKVPSPWLVSIAASAVFTVILIALKKRQFDAKWATQQLVLSPAGASLRDRDIQIDLPWHEVSAIGIVPPLKLLELNVPILSRTARPVMNAAKATLQATQCGELGLVGNGALVGREGGGLGGLAHRTQVNQNLKSGEEFGVPLLPFDPAWDSGRIGAWVRAYRPDLLA